VGQVLLADFGGVGEVVFPEAYPPPNPARAPPTNPDTNARMTGICSFAPNPARSATISATPANTTADKDNRQARQVSECRILELPVARRTRALVLLLRDGQLVALPVPLNSHVEFALLAVGLLFQHLRQLFGR